MNRGDGPKVWITKLLNMLVWIGTLVMQPINKKFYVLLWLIDLLKRLRVSACEFRGKFEESGGIDKEIMKRIIE